MKHLMLSCATALVCFLAACQAPGSSTGQDTSAVSTTTADTTATAALHLSGTHWVLKEFPGAVTPMPTLEKEVYMMFEDSTAQVKGYLGCNGFGGKFVADNSGGLVISNVMSTKMACPQLDVENTFAKAMEATTRYKIEKDMLYLQKGDSVLATFTAKPM